MRSEEKLPTPIAIEARIMREIILPTVRAVQARGVKDAHTDCRVRNHAYTVLGGEPSDRHELR